MFWLLICLLLACALCSCLLPDSGLAQSAARAFDSTVGLLSQHSTDGHCDEELQPRRVPPRPPPKAAAAPPAHTEPGCAHRGEASALHSLPGEENRCGTRLEVRMWLCGSD